MLRSAIGKVMWVGRATVFLVGIAVILAVVLGAASAAFGANGGNFILGKGNNVATRVTGLIGQVATGSSLVVKNPSGGSALGLSVGDPLADPAIKTVAPMKVDSQARVANLNADKVDGVSAEGLVRAGLGTDPNLFSTLSFTSQTSVTVNAPASGFLIVNGSVIADLWPGDNCNPCYAQAHLYNATTQEESVDNQVTLGNGTESEQAATVPMTWVFPVSAGDNTIQLRTAEFPNNSEIDFFNPTLSATYVPFGATGTSTLGSTGQLDPPKSEALKKSASGTMRE